mmetsp:Transcript_11370/g.36138  ORF Transcript_11370/g.36138 Transcript_11370/m.36138 type:complete len:213 (+) Transcript_11370:730-1368(+)
MTQHQHSRCERAVGAGVAKGVGEQRRSVSSCQGVGQASLRWMEKGGLETAAQPCERSWSKTDYCKAGERQRGEQRQNERAERRKRQALPALYCRAEQARPPIKAESIDRRDGTFSRGDGCCGTVRCRDIVVVVDAVHVHGQAKEAGNAKRLDGTPKVCLLLLEMPSKRANSVVQATVHLHGWPGSSVAARRFDADARCQRLHNGSVDACLKV